MQDFPQTFVILKTPLFFQKTLQINHKTLEKSCFSSRLQSFEVGKAFGYDANYRMMVEKKRKNIANCYETRNCGGKTDIVQVDAPFLLSGLLIDAVVCLKCVKVIDIPQRKAYNQLTYIFFLEGGETTCVFTILKNKFW